MVLFKTADWDDAGQVHNALATESTYLSYTVNHKFGLPAEAVVILADPDGSIAQKYKVDAAGDSVYIGPGRAYIEDPDGVCFFDGRIIKARPNTETHRVLLYCKDWSSQLDEKTINFYCRKGLYAGGAPYESDAIAYEQYQTNYVGATTNEAGPTYFLYDQSGNFLPAADEFNGMELVFTNDSAGNITVKNFICDLNVVGDNMVLTDAVGNNEVETWEDDDDYMVLSNNTNNFYCHFMIWGMPTRSGLYVADSIKDINVTIKYKLYPTAASCTVHVFNYTTSTMGDALETLNGQTDSDWHYKTIKIPKNILMDTIGTGVWADRFSIELYVNQSGNTGLAIDYMVIETDCSFEGVTSTYEIQDTSQAGQYLELEDDLSMYTGTDGIPFGHKYCVTELIKNYINGLVTDNDDLMTMTTSIEATTGVSTNMYEEKTTLNILNDLAKQDGVVIYVPLGSKVLTYKKTFNGAGTAVTDATFLRYNGEWDYDTMFNQVNVYGMRIVDNQLYLTDEDTTSNDTYGIYKSKVIKDNSITAMVTAQNIATSELNKNADVLLHLDVELAGKSSYVLGTELAITSALLGLTGDVYVVTDYSYDTKTYRTRLRLHPQSSVGYTEYEKDFEILSNQTKKVSKIERQLDVSKPTMVGGT